MKKIAFFAIVLFAGYLLLDNQFKFASVYAQSEKKSEKFGNARIAQDPDAKDKQLARIIRELTDRSDAGLLQESSPGGGITVDLEDRFQNVMLARIDTDGEPAAACVTSVDEANAFFGKNLETGAPVPSMNFQKDDTAAVASRHGMSEQEFVFYKNLIEEAEQSRAMSPNAATITIINGDGPGEGFNDLTQKVAEGGNNGLTIGEQRLILFNYAASIWGAYLDTSVPIAINSQFNPLSPCSTSGGVLGSAGTTTVARDFANAPLSGTWYHNALASKITGTDVNGATAEINARFNSDVDTGCLGAGSRFYYGLNNTTPSQRINLLIVLLHEMGHGLGFSSFVNGTTGALFNGMPDVYTTNMYDRNLNLGWNQMTDVQRQTSALNTSNVLWDGANVKIASGFLTNGRDASGRVQLFTPNPFQSGSSVSHFDSAATTNLLMEPMINVGLPLTLDLTRQQMRDIGWFRDTNADLIPDTIINVQPSGSTVISGSNANITWTNTGGFERNVTIELSMDGGATFPVVVASNVANTGSYSFTVPNVTTTQARIRVREADFVNPVGISVSNFVITQNVSTVSVGGRVTTNTGKGLANARVLLTDAAGQTRAATTSATGYYRFANVTPGAAYTVSVAAKRYVFTPQEITPSGDITGLNFIGQ